MKGWRDSLDTNKTLFAMMGLLFIALWLALSNVGQANPKLATTIQLFLWASVVTLIAFLVHKVRPNNRFVSFLGLGQNFNKLFVALIAGAAIAFVASGAGLSMATFSPTILDLAGLPLLTTFLLVRYASPFGEEFIFAGFLQPTLVMHLGQVWGTALNGLIFAAGHLLAYGGNLDQLIAAFIFRIVASAGNSYLDSIGFSLGAHFVFNGVI